MKITYLSYSAIPSREANSVHVMKMCRALAKHGHRVTLFARHGHEAADDVYRYYGVERIFEIVWLRQLPIGEAGKALFGCRAANALKAQRRPDLLYARDIWSLAASARLGIPMILESHNPPRKFVGRLLQRWLFKRSNFQRLVVISEALRQDYIQMFPTLPQDRLMVAPDGADIASTGAEANPAQDWGRRNGRLQVGYVGHLYPGRGVEVLMQLARRLTEADIHIVGGTEQDIALWRSQAKGITNMYWHGYVPPAKVDAFRQAMDVLVSPYQQSVVVAGGELETSRWMSPLKIFEYMAARKPIVASDLPVLREVLSHGVNALLVPPGSIDAWVSAIETLTRDAALRDRLANQAFADVLARFTWMQRAQDVLAGVLN